MLLSRLLPLALFSSLALALPNHGESYLKAKRDDAMVQEVANTTVDPTSLFTTEFAALEKNDYGFAGIDGLGLVEEAQLKDWIELKLVVCPLVAEEPVNHQKRALRVDLVDYELFIEEHTIVWKWGIFEVAFKLLLLLAYKLDFILQHILPVLKKLGVCLLKIEDHTIELSLKLPLFFLIKLLGIIALVLKGIAFLIFYIISLLVHAPAY